MAKGGENMEVIKVNQTGNIRVDLISSVRPVDEDVVKQVEAEFPNLAQYLKMLSKMKLKMVLY